MRFTDVFIERPVLATVVSLLILLVGLRSFQLMNVRQYPRTESAVVTVTTVYTGASADLVQGFVTTPLEKAIATADGIDYLESSSTQGLSTITAQLRLGYDPNAALTQISAKVNQVRNDLPAESEIPTIDLSVGETTASMYISFYSDVLHPNQITDFLERVVQPRLQTVAGVQEAQILGARTFAMRIWLRPKRMAALGVTPTDVAQALRANNFLAAAGQTKGQMISVPLSATTDLHTAQDFRRLVLKQENGTIVRLGDVATVVLGAESYDSSVLFNGKNATFIGITVAPTANPLDVIRRIRAAFPRIQAQLPAGLHGEIVYDATQYIEDSISEVEYTLAEALVIVIAVIFLFLGSLRSIVIPVVAIPLSIIGGAFVMYALGFSINLLTLLAMVLAIGLVVDDAIIVVENIHRHIEGGMAPRAAALRGARELGTPVIAMTITLVAVYAPIGFMGGLTGSLFTEFAFTLAGSVLISGVIALTLSPMMCSRLLRPAGARGGFAEFLDRSFDALRRAYERNLHRVLGRRGFVLAFAAGVLASCYFLFGAAKHELAPTEDQGLIIVQATAAPDASLDQLELWTQELTHIFQGFPETGHIFLLNGAGSTNQAISGMVLKPWSERTRSQMQLQPLVQRKIGSIAGLQAVAFGRPPLPGGGRGLPIQFVVGAVQSPQLIWSVSQKLVDAARKTRLFAFVDSDLKFDKPKVVVDIDRDKAAELGLSMRDVGDALGTMLGGGYVNRFSIQGRSYKVIPQVQRRDRLNANQLAQYYVRTRGGELVPLSTLVSLHTQVEPEALKRFQQLNSATISGVPAPGVTQGQALDALRNLAGRILPRGFQIDYAGQSRQYVQEGSALLATFFFAIVIIFLVLSAQFESFRDPLIMLVSVPMSISGALVFLALGFATVNIYTEVGLITLIGLISKHGILIVQFANQLQREEGMAKRRAIEEAAGIRLRPILMTTGAMVLGVVPLLVASGPGAVSRFDLGLVIASGLSIGTLFTLFVVPTVYLVLGAEHHRDEPAPAPAPDAAGGA